MLRHFTTCAPFKGRPFVRAWFQALVPCLSRWLLLSDRGNDFVVKTLKHILGAFGQPGIVVCLPDKGSSILKILKESACAVEAVGRGTVELYYWKRLAESSCGGGKEWQQLANIKNQDLELSQLDTLPPNWLLDNKDCVHILSKVVSPKISKRFVEYIKDTVACSNVSKDIRPGPPKTLARSLAKSVEYQSESEEDSDLARWSWFEKKFQEQFKRSPTKSEDFVWNIVDFARCSIVVKSARDLIEIKQLVEKRFTVVGLKNGYRSDEVAKGSGYRDLKLLVEVEFDGLNLGSLSQGEQKIVMICEIQLICDQWLNNKKTTSLSYKVLRSLTLRNLLHDFAKYLYPTSEDQYVYKSHPINVIKNGWKNLARFTDFSSIKEKEELLKESITSGWDPAGVEILITDLKVPSSVKSAFLAAEWGNHETLKTLLDLTSDIGGQTGRLSDALMLAISNNKEECVRVLLDAGISLSSSRHDSVLYLFNDVPAYERVLKLLKGEYVPLSKPKIGKNSSIRTTDGVVKAAVNGLFTDYLDTYTVELSNFSGILLSPAVINQFEVCLQAVWFGADVNFKRKGVTPLGNAIISGKLEVVELLLLLKADTAIKTRFEIGRNTTIRPMKQIVEALLKAGANPENSPLNSIPNFECTYFQLAYILASDQEECKGFIEEAKDGLLEEKSEN